MPLRLQTTMHRKKSFSILSQYSSDNIAQVKTWCSIAQETPDNIAQEKPSALSSEQHHIFGIFILDRLTFF